MVTSPSLSNDIIVGGDVVVVSVRVRIIGENAGR